MRSLSLSLSNRVRDGWACKGRMESESGKLREEGKGDRYIVSIQMILLWQVWPGVSGGCVACGAGS